MDYSNKAVGIDISRYNLITDWSILKQNVDFIIAKCSEGTNWTDPTFADNCQKAYDHNIPFGAYHYFRADYYTQFPLDDKERWPTPENDLQLQNLIKQIQNKKIYFLAIDYENFGNDHISGGWISESAKVFHGRVKDWLTVNKPNVILNDLAYTRNTYINESAPSMNNWIHQYGSWIAQWYWPGATKKNPGETITWEQFRAKLKDMDAKPSHFSTRATWEVWQISGDRFYLPGLKGAVDLNLYNGTKEELQDKIGFIEKPTEPVIIPITTSYKVNTRVNIRREPNKFSQSSGVLSVDEIISVSATQESDGYLWAKHARGWSAIYLIGNRYLTKM